MSAEKKEEKKKEEVKEEKTEKVKKEEPKKETKKVKKEEKAEKVEKAEKEEKAEEKVEKKKEEKAEEPKAVEASSKNVAKIVDMVKELTVMELSELVKVLEDLFGVSASAPVAMVAGGVPGAAAADDEEQTEFDVILKDVGSQKIPVIKVIRAITGLGLIEAKKLVESAPAPVKEGAGKEEAEEIKSKIEEVGATVELK